MPTPSTITVTTAVVEWILLLRVWAIYRPKRYIRFIALFFYFGGISSLVALTITDYVADTVTVRLTTWWKDRRSVPPTLILLARDSTIYFAVIFALLITNLFVFEYGPPFLSSLMVTPVNTAGCIAVIILSISFADYLVEYSSMTTGVTDVAQPTSTRKPKRNRE
ncbi:hypothetical protein HWV62_27331 [Athelia sp. TMB]|nr:hypothetical protein HWV62_27331 [Athelia sp. TMB]